MTIIQPVNGKPPLVALRWKDAHGTAVDACAIHEIPHAAIEITSYGLLLRQDADGVSIASEECKDGTYRGITFVPASLVVEIKPARPTRKKREPRVHVQHD